MEATLYILFKAEVMTVGSLRVEFFPLGPCSIAVCNSPFKVLVDPWQTIMNFCKFGGNVSIHWV